MVLEEEMDIEQRKSKENEVERTFKVTNKEEMMLKL